ncbi:MAG TPA: family 16 glycoside hydrolase [Candidatus Angelobacter sp.]|jgi:hypothetical protein|nr:family 16 glycoside hydrolase [Candidatus Angelobacter sp.]
MAVLVDSSNSTGYNGNSSSPGKYQCYAERYFEHLQIPYELFDVSAAAPPADLNLRQLIVAAQPGLALPATWQAAIVNAVKSGSGFVNLDSSPQPATSQHLLTIFRATGFVSGTAGTTIMVPAALGSGGANTHFISAMQWKSPLEVPGDFVYSFHPDQNGNLNSATATILQNATGTVIARLGNDPLIIATTFGSGRAVNFGTLDYLQADRFGFMMGVDDLFWRSLVWAARKPFVVRGYPKLWALRMDHNVDTNWWTRVQEMYDPALTGNAVPDGSPWGVGGPWKVTGSVYLNFLQPGQTGRAEIINDMKAGNLQLSPHGFQSSEYGDLFWAGTDNPPGPLTDAEEQASIQAILNWEGKSSAYPIADPLPDKGLSRWLVGHFYDLSDNLGYDLWNLGFRYVSATERPGFEYTTTPSDSGFQTGRLYAYPFWEYELPPKLPGVYASDESFSFLFADDLTIHSRAGLPSRDFFLVGSRALNSSLAGTPDVEWCNSAGNGIGFSQGKFEWYTWRLFSSLAPVELYTHDDSFSTCAAAPVNSAYSPLPQNVSLPGGLAPNASQQVIFGVSNWLNAHGAHQVFMGDMAQYSYARNKSVLSQAMFDGSQINYTFTGKAADADGNLVPTQVLVFSGDDEGQWQTVPGFNNGLATAIAPPPPPVVVPVPPAITRMSPTAGPASGGNIINIYGSSFTADTQVTIGGIQATGVVVINPTLLSAVVPANATGTQAAVAVSNSGGQSTLAAPYIYLDPSKVLLQDSFNGDSSAGWTNVPASLANGWSNVNNARDYAGIGGSQQYAGRSNWQDYTFEVKIDLFTLQNYPGGIRARVNPATGAGYALWLYPGSNQVKLFRATAWNIDAPGLGTLATASLNFDTNTFHTVQLKVTGTNIQAIWDGTTLFSVTDASYATGGVALEGSSQHIEFEDALVTGTPVPPISITGLTLSPANLSLAIGGISQQLALSAKMSDGSTFDLTSNAATVYSSGNPSVATVNSSGLLTPIAGGTSTITASNSGFSATASIAVTSPYAPAITRISPTQGATGGGYSMDIYGSNLKTSDMITIQNQIAEVVSASSDGSMLTVVVPPGVAGAADLVVSDGSGVPTTLAAGFTYRDPSRILFEDPFNSASLTNWTPSPLGLFTGWTPTQDAADYNGGGHTQIFAGSSSWTDYTVEVQFKVFAAGNYPGGLRGRVNPVTGAGYEAWVLPASNLIVLYRTAAWNIDTPGLTLLGTASVTVPAHTFNNLKLSFSGTQISVIYNGAAVITVNDSAFPSGAIALDVSNQHIQFDDVLVTTP